MQTGSIPPANPLSYEGQVVVPFINRTFNPSTTFNKFPVPTIWINTAAQTAFIQVAKPLGVAAWVPIGGVPGNLDRLTGNSGGPITPTANNINIVGDGTTITVAGTLATSTLLISATGAMASLFTSNSGTATPSGGNLNIVGGTGITTSGSGSTITIGITSVVDILFTADDATTATPSGGNVIISGGSTGLTTTASGHTLSLTGTLGVAHGGTGAVTLNNHSVLVGAGTSAITQLTVGPTGQLLVGATAADPAFASSAAGDFTFTSATSGATRTFTVSNTSNTASSTAIISAITAGTSAGNPYYKSSITGGQNWSWGLNNSDSQAFDLSASATLGTTNVIRASTSGTINYPLQSAFSANISGNVTNATGDGTAYTVAFNTTQYDQHSDFSSPTFTCPVTGKYLFSATISLANLNSSHTQGIVSIASSGTNQYLQFNPFAMQSSGGICQVNFSTIQAQSSGANVTIVVSVSGGTKTVTVIGTANGSSFQGLLVA